MLVNGDWGLGIGDWGLGIGPNPQSPIPIINLKYLNTCLNFLFSILFKYLLYNLHELVLINVYSYT
jgi:hypothetical protein